MDGLSRNEGLSGCLCEACLVSSNVIDNFQHIGS